MDDYSIELAKAEDGADGERFRIVVIGGADVSPSEALKGAHVRLALMHMAKSEAEIDAMFLQAREAFRSGT